MATIKANIQQVHGNSDKYVLQALVPFKVLKDAVIFTCKANPNGREGESKKQLAEENIKYYQRRIDDTRLAEIHRFILTAIMTEKEGRSIATLFPTALILAITDDANEIKIDEADKERCTIDFRSNAFIVDGQHRMMAMITLYDKLNKRDDENSRYAMNYLDNFKFNCEILVNYDMWEQGEVFANVNFKQKPVNKSLYYEVFGARYPETGVDKKRNQMYLAHCLVKELNTREKSPFLFKIKMIGSGHGYVSQAFFVEALIRNFRVGGIWSIYADKEAKDDDVYYMLTELLTYFVAVYDRFKNYWPKPDALKPTLICKTTSIGAFVRLMKDFREAMGSNIVNEIKATSRGELCSNYLQEAENLLKRISTDDAEKIFGVNSKYDSQSGQGSEGNLYKELRTLIFGVKLKQTRVKLPIQINQIADDLRDYLWTTIDSELDSLTHHYEYEDLDNLDVLDCKKDESGDVMINVKFDSGVTLYMDSDDEMGATMRFPTKAMLRYSKKGEWRIERSQIKVEFDTSKYFQ